MSFLSRSYFVTQFLFECFFPSVVNIPGRIFVIIDDFISSVAAVLADETIFIMQTVSFFYMTAYGAGYAGIVWGTVENALMPQGCEVNQHIFKMTIGSAFYRLFEVQIFQDEYRIGRFILYDFTGDMDISRKKTLVVIVVCAAFTRARVIY